MVPALPAFPADLPEALARCPECGQWLQHLAVERRLAAATLSAYAAELVALVAASDGAPLTVTAMPLRTALAQAHAAGLSPRSLARRLSCWRGFYRWARARGLIAADPTAGLKAPKAPRLLPKALAVDEAVAFLDRLAQQAQAEPEPLMLRDRAIAELLYATGIRVGELVALDCNAPGSDWAAGRLTVTGKRAKTRTVPVGRSACEAVTAWLRVRPLWARPEEPALFITPQGQRLSAQGVASRLAYWARRFGFASRLNPHQWRHSYASHLLQSSGDLRAVQELLGHASIASTQVYTHLDAQHLLRVYEAAHPRARASASSAVTISPHGGSHPQTR